MLVELPERAFLQTIAELHEQFRQCFAEPDPITIDAARFEQGDLSVVQLIASARLQATARNREIALAQPANAALAALLDRSGMTPTTRDDALFWFHGDIRP